MATPGKTVGCYMWQGYALFTGFSMVDEEEILGCRVTLVLGERLGVKVSTV
jgi:hypothetical protein